MNLPVDERMNERSVGRSVGPSVRRKYRRMDGPLTFRATRTDRATIFRTKDRRKVGFRPVKASADNQLVNQRQWKHAVSYAKSVFILIGRDEAFKTNTSE